jgi:tetratricopeptide (TPR) repeat protein
MSEYAAEKLAQGGDPATLTRRRAEWVARLADCVRESSWRGERAAARGAVQETENARAALSWALGPDGDVGVAGRIAGGLTPVWQARSIGEGVRYIERVLERLGSGALPATEALLWISMGAMSPAKRRVECAKRAAAIYEAQADSEGLAHALRIESEGLRQMGKLESAEAAVDRALALHRKVATQTGPTLAALLRTRASILTDAGRVDEARATFDEALRLLSRGNDELGLVTTKMLLADLEFSASNVSRALELGDECRRDYARLGDVSKQALMLATTAAYRLANEDIDGAERAAREALELSLKARVGLYLTFALQHLGVVAALRGDARRAASLLAYADHRLEAEGFERELAEQLSYDLGMKTVSTYLSDVELDQARLEAARMAEEDALADARSQFEPVAIIKSA